WLATMRPAKAWPQWLASAARKASAAAASVTGAAGASSGAGPAATVSAAALSEEGAQAARATSAAESREIRIVFIPAPYPGAPAGAIGSGRGLPEDQHRDGGMREHLGGLAAKHHGAEAAPPVGGHRDQV